MCAQSSGGSSVWLVAAIRPISLEDGGESVQLGFRRVKCAHLVLTSVTKGGGMDERSVENLPL